MFLLRAVGRQACQRGHLLGQRAQPELMALLPELEPLAWEPLAGFPPPALGFLAWAWV